jgi:methyl-accepting chemotaxis protein
MTATAEQMAASADRTGSSANSAATESARALANTQTVASAAEQLSASIREISVQMTRSGAIVNSAVQASSETRTSMETLNERVSHIGAVADIISEIAARTNLLALNATIEAARAGDAGKGFAVVASEVKALAIQTARSTQQIAQHIAEVRTATGASVTAVQRIEQTISEIDAIAGSIAAAVEQQGAATAEIARNIAETAAAAGAMTSHVQDVSREAEQTGMRATEVCKDAAGLNKAVVELRQAVIRTVRTSTTEMDRRTTRRHQVDLPCRLSVPGQAAFPARLNDISIGGASLRSGPSLPKGTSATLHIDGIGLMVPCVVHSRDDEVLRLHFPADDMTAAKLRPILDRLGEGRAA